MDTNKTPIHLIITGIYLILLIVTLIPYPLASKECLLGYKALCSFAPISALIFLALAGLHIFLHNRALAKS